MGSTADLAARRAVDRGAGSHHELLDGLRVRLETAERLTGEMRDGLVRADVAAIESATARLETLALEYKVLAEEYRRVREQGPAAAPDDARLESARAALERTATRIARSSAIAGGLLQRMVAISRALLATLSADAGPAYLPSGRSAESESRGLRLREQA